MIDWVLFVVNLIVIEEEFKINFKNIIFWFAWNWDLFGWMVKLRLFSDFIVVFKLFLYLFFVLFSNKILFM